jgi:integrase
MPFQLPPGCTIKNGRYYLVRHNKWHGLTRVSDGEIAFWRAYYTLTQAEPNTMAGVMLAYLDHGTADLTEGSRKKYEQAIVTRLIPYCGHMAPEMLNSSHVAQYLEARKKAGAAIAGNRERAALSSACNYAMRKGWMTTNPCHGVRRNKERPATRYIEHDELVPALDRAPPALYDILAAAYLTGLRQSDLRSMRKDQVTEHGLLVTESKTGKERLIEWTPTLRKIISAAMHRSTNEFVFTSAKGLPWSVWGLQSAMRRFEAGFKFRELRPKAASDAAHNVLGHGEAMLRVYKRRHRLKPVK